MELSKVKTVSGMLKYVRNLGYDNGGLKESFVEFLEDNPDCMYTILDWIEENYPEEDHSVEFEGDE